MVREPDTTTQPPPQDQQLMPKRRVLGFKPQPRLKRRGEDGQHETAKPDHPASLGDQRARTQATHVAERYRTLHIDPASPLSLDMQVFTCIYSGK
jgi:hypothetical protein